MSEHKNIELEISSEGSGYLLKVRSQQGEARAQFNSPFEDKKIKAFLDKVRKARLSTRERRKTTGQEKLKEEDFEKFGKRLFKKVFKEGARDLLMRSLPDNRDEKVRLRMNFQEKASKLAGLPWEYLWNPTEDDFFCIFKSTSLVRYLEIPKSRPPLEVKDQLRILVAIANPHGDLDVSTEVNSIQQALEPLKERGSIFYETLKKTAWSNLKEELDKGNYHILHFVGHGTFDAKKEEGSLLLEDGPVKHKDLRRFIGNISSLRLAILNSCNGAKSSESNLFWGLAQQLVMANIPAIIAMQFAITDKAAIKFSHEFYKIFIHHRNIEHAFIMARVALAETKSGDEEIEIAEWGTPVLFLRSDSTNIFGSLSPLDYSFTNHSISELLPYLPDRDEQEYAFAEALEKALESPSLPLTCIIHGHDDQCIDKFIERLEKISLPRLSLMDLQFNKVTTYTLRWPKVFEDEAGLINKISMNLSECVSGYRKTDLEETRNFLARIPGLVLIHTHVLSEDWLSNKKGIIEGYLDFWQKWELPYGQVLVACLCVKYQHKENLPFWKRQLYKRINNHIEQYLKSIIKKRSQQIHCVVLPKLDCVTRSQAEDWARFYHKIYQYDLHNMIKGIKQIYKTWEAREKCESIPMEYLANELQLLLHELEVFK